MGSATLDASHIKSLVATLGSALKDPNALDEPGRIAALKAAKSLTEALEPPQNAIPQMWLMVSLPSIYLPTQRPTKTLTISSPAKHPCMHENCRRSQSLR